jgi:hypothetical protein
MSDEGGGDRDFTEVTYESYGEKMKASFCGVCIGLLLFFGSWGVLFWNEGRAVSRQKDLDEGVDAVKQLGTLAVANVTIDDGLQGQLVYVNGMLSGSDATPIVDPDFNMDVTNATGAIRYERVSEMYQWKQSSSTKTTKLPGGKTQKTTTYSYNKVWDKDLISSSSFKEAGHTNPTTRLVEGYSQFADRITVGGALDVDDSILDEVDWWTPWYNFPLDESAFQYPGYVTTVTSSDVMLTQGSTNTVGDTRVSFQIVEPEQVSIVAMLQDKTLKPYMTKSGNDLYLFSVGTVTSDALFNEATEDNNTLTWILRFVGFLLMVFGVWLILNPIAAVFDVLPFCGDALEGLIGGCIIPCLAFVICLPLTILIISIAWIFYRPVFAAVTGVMLILLVVLWIKYLKPKLQKPSPQGKPPSNNNNESPTAAAEVPSGAPEVPFGEPGYGQSTANEPAPFSMALDTDGPPPSSNNNNYGGGYGSTPSAPPDQYNGGGYSATPSAPPPEPIPPSTGGYKPP